MRLSRSGWSGHRDVCEGRCRGGSGFGGEVYGASAVDFGVSESACSRRIVARTGNANVASGSENVLAKNSNFYPVILAGGRGTRFWPLSRKKRAKQLLALDGKHTMIQQTVARLLPLAQPKKFWIITNEDLRPAIAKQLPKLPKPQILPEPAARNTAPAIGLAAFLLARDNPDAVIGLFPSDHVIGDEKRYRETLQRGIDI